MGKFESALADCERAILINPNYISAYDYKAEALYHINKETVTKLVRNILNIDDR